MVIANDNNARFLIFSATYNDVGSNLSSKECVKKNYTTYKEQVSKISVNYDFRF